MAKRPAPILENTERPVAASVDRLAAEVRVIREVLDAIRDEVSWGTNNGLPVQPAEHVHVKCMARDVTSIDRNDRLVIERPSLHPPGRLGRLRSLELDRLMQELRGTVETLAQGQIEPILNALDEVRTALVMAMQRDRAIDEKASEDSPVATLFSPNSPAPTQVRDGRLF